MKSQYPGVWAIIYQSLKKNKMNLIKDPWSLQTCVIRFSFLTSFSNMRSYLLNRVLNQTFNTFKWDK